MRATYEGSCHCGAIGWKFTTELEPTSWTLRACQCEFCRAHGARCTSDPAGFVDFSAADPESLSRYRFGLRTADFVTCANCGVYIGAVMDGPHGQVATINLNSMTTPVESLPVALPISYDGENSGERVERRLSRWTPVRTTFRS